MRFHKWPAAVLMTALLGPIPQAGPAEQAAEHWYVVSIGGSPIGYVRESTSRTDGPSGPELATDSTMKMVLNRLGTKVEIEASTRSAETPDGRLIRQGYAMRASVMSTRSEAVVKDGRVEVRSEAGGKTYTRTVPYQGTLIGPEGVRRLSLEKIKGPGDGVEYLTFSSELEKPALGRRKALAWDSVPGPSGPVRCLRVEEELEGAGTKVLVWLDDRHEPLAQQMPTPFGDARIVPATRAQALAAAGGASLPEEMYSRSIIRANIRIPQARALKSMRVVLTRRTTDRPWPDLGTTNQVLMGRTERTMDIWIKRAEEPRPSAFPAPAAAELKPFLEPNAVIQSDDPAIRKTAASIVAGEKNAWPAVLKLQRWVAENMQFDLGIAMAPASELFKNRRGTCLGYATLLAALARAVGIPSRVVLGYVYALGIFGGHAWTEVYIGGAWVPADAAVPAPGTADPARIALAAASLFEGSGSLTAGPSAQLLGQIDIRIVGFMGADSRYVSVPGTAAGYAVEGDFYRNPWLGLEWKKPAGFQFAKLDAIWPESIVAALAGPKGQTAELDQVYLPPWIAPETAVRAVLSQKIEGRPIREIRIGARRAFSAESAGLAGLAVGVGAEAFLLTVKASNAAALLRDLAKGLSFR